MRITRQAREQAREQARDAIAGAAAGAVATLAMEKVANYLVRRTPAAWRGTSSMGSSPTPRSTRPIA